jgi:transcriptional regulator with XRE-family HTH domain
MDLTALLSSFRQFVAQHPETKKIAFAKAIGTSPSGLSAILNGTNNPTATQALEMLNVIRGGTTRIVGLQENLDHCDGNPNQRIELNDRNIAYLERFNRKIEVTLFDNGDGRVAREGADPSEDPANGNGDPTDDLDDLFGQLGKLYKAIGNVLKAMPNQGSAGTIPRQPGQRFSNRYA